LVITFAFTSLASNFAFGMVRLKQQVDHSDSIPVISQTDLSENAAALQRKLIQGAKDGVFYVEMSQECKALIPDALAFGDRYPQDEELKQRKFPGLTGYHDRENMQVESFYAERTFWSELFSDRVCRLAHEMNALAQDLLSKTLHLVAPHITDDQLARATCNVAANSGQYHLSFHHYRAEKSQAGLVPHKDFGYVTVLSINKPGLVAKLNGVWGSVLPRENCFIINFGSALEMFVNDTDKLTAVLHAVEHIDDPNRVTFGIFTDGAPECPFNGLNKDGFLETLYPKYQDYLAERFKVTYGAIDQ
jgi:2OG-Fe(II) oxygenase superfamily